MAVLGDEGGARVEADARVARHQRVVGEPQVRLGVGDDHHARPARWCGRRRPCCAGSRSTGRPTALLNHWRSASTRETAAMGTPQMWAARRVISSKSSSVGVSRTRQSCRAFSLASSFSGSGAVILETFLGKRERLRPAGLPSLLVESILPHLSMLSVNMGFFTGHVRPRVADGDGYDQQKSADDPCGSSALLMALFIMACLCFMPKARLELARPCEHCDLNTACIPFHHFGTMAPRVSAGTNAILPAGSGVVKMFGSLRGRKSAAGRVILSRPRKKTVPDEPDIPFDIFVPVRATSTGPRAS